MKRTIATFLVMMAMGGLAATVGLAQNGSDFFLPGNLLVSRSVYDNNPATVQVGDSLPPNCVPLTCQSATSDGTYPFVWNNDIVDSSFGITSKIVLDQLTPGGVLINSLEVPNSSQNGVRSTKDQVVTSFSSKSELALNLSTDGRFVTFLGYVAPIDGIDVSNSNTPGIIDPTDPVPGQAFRGVVQVDQKGKFQFTKSESYSGNNGRAAILNNSNGANVIYTAGNGVDPQPDAIIIAAGAQILNSEIRAMVAQSPGLPTPVGSFDITQLPGAKYQAGDKLGKDTYTNATVDASGKTKAKVFPGLQKWVFDGTQWNRKYTLQAGLSLGIPYSSLITGYPTGNNDVRTAQSGKPAPWNPATGGLRNITGRVNSDGTVTIWGITSTVSGNGDQGVDPNQLVMITDTLSASTPAGESFTVVRRAGFGEVLRGVSFTPGTKSSS